MNTDTTRRPRFDLSRVLMIVDGDHPSQRGGPEHEYWKHRLAERLRADGYEVALEERLAEGHYVDIIARREGEAIAVEVETGKSDVAANVRRCVEGEVDRVVVAATSQAAYHHAQRAMGSAGFAGPAATMVRAVDLVRERVSSVCARGCGPSPFDAAQGQLDNRATQDDTPL